MKHRYSGQLFILALLLCLAMPNEDKSFRIVGLCEQNMEQELGCALSPFEGPLDCQNDEDWVFLFYNSSNVRQQSTFEYLVPGYAKQLLYARQYHNSFTFPPTAIIDCHTCPSLCDQIPYEDLPLAIYRTAYYQNLKYKGYVSLPGLLSFIKSHDPATSYLAEQYIPQGPTVDQHNLSQEQINKFLQKIQNIVNSQKLQQLPKKQQAVRDYNQQSNAGKESQVSQNDRQLQTGLNNSKGEEIEGKIQASNSQAEGKKEKVKQKSTEKQQGKQVRQDRKKKEEKQQSRNLGSRSKSDFLSAVEGATEAVVGGFAYLGFGGIVLSFISSVCYGFFFLLFGLLCLLIHL